MRERKTGTSRQSSVKERQWPPPDKDSKSSTSSSKRESSRAAEHNRQKLPSGRTSSTSSSITSEQTSSPSSSSNSSRYSLRSSKATEYNVESDSQRSSLKLSPREQSPDPQAAGGTASQTSGENRAFIMISSEKKSHTSSHHSKIFPEAKQVMVVESPKHQGTFNFTSSAQAKRWTQREEWIFGLHGPVTRKVGTITITSQKKTPSPAEQPTVQQPSDDTEVSSVPVSSSSEPPRNTLPNLTMSSSKSKPEATPHSSHSSHHHRDNITHIPDLPTSPGPYNSGNMLSGNLRMSNGLGHAHDSFQDGSHKIMGRGLTSMDSEVDPLPVSSHSSGVKDQTNPNSLDGSCKVVGGGLPSMEVDPHTPDKPSNVPEKNIKNLQESLTASSKSTASCMANETRERVAVSSKKETSETAKHDHHNLPSLVSSSSLPDEHNCGSLTNYVSITNIDIDEVSSGRERAVTNTDRPYDPNLVCPMCNKPFRIGEIQKFRTHVNQCEGKKKYTDIIILKTDL